MTTTSKSTAGRSVLVLGSTGSIGTQALDVIAAQPERFTVAGLAAGGADVGAARRAGAGAGCAGSPSPIRRPPGDAARRAARRRGARRAGRGHRAHRDDAAPTTCSTASPARVGLGPTLAALAPGATLALANKESLVAGGPLVTAAAGAGADRAGRLRALRARPVPARRRARRRCARLVLTASGGPFRGRRRAELADVTPAAGARAPDLGDGPGGHHQLRDAGQQGAGADRGAPAVRRARTTGSTSSCTRSRWCTRWSTFTDGSTIAQACPPDMRLPIALALGWPERVPGVGRVRLDAAHGLDVRAAGRRRLPGCAARPARRRGGRTLPGGVQRGQRGGRRRVRRGRGGLPGRHRRRRAHAGRGRWLAW